MSAMENVAPIIAPNRDLMLSHLTFLFGRAMSGQIEITAIKATGDGERVSPKCRFFEVDDIDEAAEYAASINSEPQWNVYVGAATRRPETFPNEPACDEDFHKAWAVHADVDDGEALAAAREKYRELQMTPPLVVVTGRTPSTRAQFWWPLDEPIADRETYKKTLRAIARALGTDPSVTAAKQLMRLAGGVNWPKKSGRKMENVEVSEPRPAQAAFSLEQIHNAFPTDAPTTSETPRAAVGTIAGALSQHDLRSALASMRADDRDLWVRMGHALKDLGDIGRGLWIEWSQTSDKYDAADAARKWDSFHPTSTDHRAVFAEAQRGGWANPAAGTGRVEEPKAEPEVARAEAKAFAFDPWERYVVPPFPMDVLPPLLRRFVEHQAVVLGADRSGVAVAALVACSAAISHDYRLKMMRTGDWHVRPRLWAVLVGDPSDKKTPIINAVSAPLHERDIEASSAYAKRHAAWQEAVEEKQASKRDEPPKPARQVVQDVTVEKLSEILSRTDRGTLVQRDELGGWVGSMEQYKSKGGAGSADRAHWIKTYDGGRYTVDRVKGETVLSNFSISFLAGIQPDRLAELGNLTSDGLLQRFLPVMLGKPSLPTEVEDDKPAKDYEWLIGYIAETQPVRVLCENGAHDVIKAFQAQIHELEQSGAFSKSMTGFLGKLPGVLGSLMLVLHLVEDPENGRGMKVEQRTAEAAQRLLLEFFIPHALEFYRGADDKTDGDTLRAIASYLLTSDLTRFRPKELTANVNSLRGLGLWDLQRKLSPLIAGGWLRPEDDTPTCRAWLIEDGVREAFNKRAEAEAIRRERANEFLRRTRGEGA